MRPKSYGNLPGTFLGYNPFFIALFLLLVVLTYVGILLNDEYLKYGFSIFTGLLILVISLQFYYIVNQRNQIDDKEWEQAINTVLCGIIISDSKGQIIDINRVGSEILGITSNRASTLSLVDGFWGLVDRNGKLMDKDEIPISITLNTCKPVVKEILGVNNTQLQKSIWLEVSAIPILNKEENVKLVLLLFNEITDQINSMKLLNEKNEKLRQMSLTDYLLNIPNRRYFNSYLTEVWAESKKSGTPVTLFLIEFDYMKEYRKEHHFSLSDHVLIEVAKRLSETVNRQGVVTRFEGNQFAVIYSGLFGKQISERRDDLKNRLIQLPDEDRLESNINDFTIYIGTSTRVATDHADYHNLIEEANEDLNHAKQRVLESMKRKTD